MQATILKYLLLICFAYVYVRLLVPYVGFFARFMFNEPVKWDKYVEKPRLVFYGTGLILMHTSYSSILEFQSNPSSFYFIGNCCIFLGGILVSQVTWSKKFKTVFIPRIKEQLKKEHNFNVLTTKNQLKELYSRLVNYDMLITERMNQEDFVRVFKEDWHTHDAKIYFKLDAPSCREFYELFSLYFPKNSLSLISFFKRSNTIRREDGKPYTYSTIKDAKSRTPISKKSEELKTIFSNL